MIVAATTNTSMEESTAHSAGRRFNVQVRRHDEEAAQQSHDEKTSIESLSHRLRQQDRIPIVNGMLLRDEDKHNLSAASHQTTILIAIAVGVPMTIPVAIPIGSDATILGEAVCAEVVNEVVAEIVVEAVSKH